MSLEQRGEARVRRILADRPDVVERRMIGGGIAFMVGGHMCCGVGAKGLTIRVGPEARAAALAMPHVSPLEIGGRKPVAFVVVGPDAYRTDRALRTWIERGLRFVATL
jgi:hypothetical protein